MKLSASTYDITWQKSSPPPNLSCRYFTHATETILWAAKNKKSKHVFNYKDMKKMNGGKQMTSVWRIGAPGKKEKEFGKHPTQKPIELLDRIVLSSTNQGDIILDPFNGSGTAGLSAHKNGRKYIGIDNNEDYLDLTIKRFNKQIGEN
jgi:site-specific DNA-methyltransferase (adenine-specific)